MTSPERVWVRKIISVLSALCGCPGVPTASVNLSQGYEMVDVQTAGVGKHKARVGILPSARDNLAAGCVEYHRTGTFLYQNLLPGVLTVSILVDPITIQIPIIGNRFYDSARGIVLGTSRQLRFF